MSVKCRQMRGNRREPLPHPHQQHGQKILNIDTDSQEARELFPVMSNAINLQDFLQKRKYQTTVWPLHFPLPIANEGCLNGQKSEIESCMV